ncbi:MAG TPA: carotenoid 1,2-hydratase [Acidobacteria bacterium]|nr:carotenoid 1,2-hydratase [Acidobacteriota bacterium]
MRNPSTTQGTRRVDAGSTFLRGTSISAVCLVTVAALARGPAMYAQTPGSVTSDGWRQAEAGYDLQFPRDHGSHPGYRIEWWYYTGNLAAEDGRRFGYQVTFFRAGVDPAPKNPSRWAVRDLFMAHLAVTDMSRARHLVAERLDRGGVGWAGAREGTLSVWNGDWRADLVGQTHQLVAVDRQFGVDLSLEPGKGAIPHGERGLSRKGVEPGNASYYYSMTRMPTSGHLVLDGETISVTGASWMDHEFGTTFLEPSQVGWDWFSLQLDDGSDLMVFRIRRDDGGRDSPLAGTWVDADAEITVLSGDDVTLEPGRRWTSPASEAVYPVEWRLAVPVQLTELRIEAVIDTQELDTRASTGVTYWEGAVTVSGRVGERTVKGRGYLEMTGYAGQPMSEVFR